MRPRGGVAFGLVEIVAQQAGTGRVAVADLLQHVGRQKGGKARESARAFREVDLQAGRAFDPHQFRRPSRQINDAHLPGNRAARRPHRHSRNALAPRNRQMLAAGIDGRNGQQVGLKLASLAAVDGGADAFDLLQAHFRTRIDQAGIDVHAFGVDHKRAGRNGHMRADRLDFAVLDNDGAVRNIG